MTQTNNRKMQFWAPKMGPKLGSKIPRDIDPSLLGHPSGARWPQDGPKMAQDAQDAPKMAQDGPNMAQDSPKMGQDAPKMPQDGPKMAQRCPKMAPRWPQMPTTRLPWRPSFFLGPAECADAIEYGWQACELRLC